MTGVDQIPALGFTFSSRCLFIINKIIETMPATPDPTDHTHASRNSWRLLEITSILEDRGSSALSQSRVNVSCFLLVVPLWRTEKRVALKRIFE